MSVLEVNGLNKTFRGGLFEKDRQVLTDVSFALPEGQASGFVGGNGQGKTTTLKCLLRFIRPDSGEIRFFGEPLGASAKSRIGYLPERPYLYEFLTGDEFLRFFWDLSGLKAGDFHARASEVLRLVELSEHRSRRLRSYSKGMLQRIGLAQALLHKPDFLLLDEPMSGLDPDGRLLVKDILQEQKRAGVSLFFSSHLLQDMDEICDHLVVIDQGRIKFDGELAVFRRDHVDLEKAFRAFRKKGEGV